MSMIFVHPLASPFLFTSFSSSAPTNTPANILRPFICSTTFVNDPQMQRRRLFANYFNSISIRFNLIIIYLFIYFIIRDPMLRKNYIETVATGSDIKLLTSIKLRNYKNNYHRNINRIQLPSIH